MFHSIQIATLYGSIGGVAGYALARLSVGAKAERYPFAPIATVLFLSPWWAAVFAGLACHAACAMVSSLWMRRPIASGIRALFMLAAFGLAGGFAFSVSQLTDDLIALDRQSSTRAWTQIIQSGDAGSFVASHYRNCVAARVTVPSPYGWRAMPREVPATDPLVCEHAAISLARQQRGEEFARQVSVVIEALPQTLALSPEEERKLATLIRG
ncbi:hypothetical protein [Paraburkholderia sp. SIMBA_054]|uniref:hypothetical protein n=1 Tax=Paraburkholderia sp. SIMBA_054 TaxID=3085795 RepID=UPI00397CC592